MKYCDVYISEKDICIQKIYELHTEEEIREYFIKNNLLVWKYNNKPINIEVNNEVRYVRLSLQEKVSFHLDEIEVWNGEDENIALGKPIIMSSTYKQNKPVINKNATNGKITGIASFHTKNERNPWVVLDLENYELIKSIKLFNREGKYFTRALSILVETSSNLRDWRVIFDNYAFKKNLNIDLLTQNQKDILDDIFNGMLPFLESNLDAKSLLKVILERSSMSQDSKVSKFIKYVLMAKVKSYYQMKVEIKKSSNIKDELNLVNDAIRLVYGDNFVFTLEHSLEKSVRSTSCNKYGIESVIYKLFIKMDEYNKNSEEYNFILYAILCKYRAISRLSKELKNSKEKLETSQLIQKCMDFVYGEGYTFTQHGIRKNLFKQFSQDNIQNILDEINSLSLLLEEKFGVKHYIDSGTMLGAVRNGKFIEHDDDMDTAYISKESKYINIWSESLAIRNYLASLDKYEVSAIMPGLFHLKVKGKVKFKVDIFIGWFEGSQYFKFPSRPSVLRRDDMLPLKKIELHGKLLSVPNNYEKVLEHMYGEGWRIPDPAYRCPWDDRRSFFYERLINTDTQCPLISWVEADLDNMNKENITMITNKRFVITIHNTIGDFDKRKITEMIQNKQNSFFISFSEFFIDDLSNYIYIMKLIYTLKNHKFRFVGKVDNIGILVELTSLENTIK